MTWERQRLQKDPTRSYFTWERHRLEGEKERERESARCVPLGGRLRASLLEESLPDAES